MSPHAQRASTTPATSKTVVKRPMTSSPGMQFFSCVRVNSNKSANDYKVRDCIQICEANFKLSAPEAFAPATRLYLVAGLGVLFFEALRAPLQKAISHLCKQPVPPAMRAQAHRLKQHRANALKEIGLI